MRSDGNSWYGVSGFIYLARQSRNKARSISRKGAKDAKEKDDSEVGTLDAMARGKSCF